MTPRALDAAVLRERLVRDGVDLRRPANATMPDVRDIARRAYGVRVELADLGDWGAGRRWSPSTIPTAR